MKKFKKLKLSVTVSAVLMIALGIVLMAIPNIAVSLICYLIGGVLVVSGAITILNFLFFGDQLFGFAYGIFNILIGILFVSLAKTELMETFFAVAIAIIFVTESVFKMQTSLDYKRLGVANWWVEFVLSIIVFVFATLLFILRCVGAGDTGVFLGITLIADGVSTILTLIFVTRKINSK
ncbi:MAG: DUF308 domain-containing protein, partial [Clostridia bacterium]